MNNKNDRRRVAWRKRYRNATGLAPCIHAHHIRMRFGIDWACRQIPRLFQLQPGGPHFEIESGRIALYPDSKFLPIKEKQ